MNPPGRPIVSGIESLMARLGEYKDLQLQPLVRDTATFLKDTKHILQLLSTYKLGANTVLTTADVSSLYTNIEHLGAIKAVRWAIKKSHNFESIHRRFVLKCLDFCLHHNYFWYNNKYYLQIKGVAMGAKFAPSVANLYMAKWEEEGVLLCPDPRIILYKRFIDYLIIVWNGAISNVENLFLSLNHNDRNIRLTWEANAI